TAEQTPLSAWYLAELIQEAGFPLGVVNIFSGFGETAGDAIDKHPRILKVAFTGATEIGKRIQERATGNLNRLSLELGGKSSNIDFSDADLSKAIPGPMISVFVKQGHACPAGSHRYMHKKVYHQLIAEMTSPASRIKLRAGLDDRTKLGPLVSAVQI